MKAFYVMFVVFAVLLFAAPMALAQDGAPSCPGGSAYDLTGHGCVTGYTNGSAAAASITPKVAGLAAPAQAAQQNQGWPGCPWGAAYDPMVQGFVAECFWRPTDNGAAIKPAGLAKPAPVEQFVPCSFGEGIDPLLDPQALACLSQPFPAAKAASKPAGLAAPAPAVIPEQGLPCLSWGDVYDPMMMLRYGPECVIQPADSSAAPKIAGLAKPAPVEQFVPCSFSEGIDPLLDPQALACLSQSFPTAKAASKPSGLAAPAPAVIPEQGWPGCPWGATYDPTVQGFIAECFWRPTDNGAAIKPAGLAAPAPAVIPEKSLSCLSWGDAWDPMTHALVQECLSWSADNLATSKTAGLAKLAPVEQFVPCSFGEGIDPLLDPLALACLSQPFPAAKAASKPAGLAAPAPAVVPEQVLSCQGWGDAAHNAWADAAYNPMLYGYVPECVSRPADNAAALKSAGLAKLAPVEGFDPCGFSEQLDPLLDPLALACLSQPFPAAKAASKPAGLAAPAPTQQQFGPCGAGFDPLTLACL